MSAEQVERAQEPLAVTDDFQNPAEPWLTGSGHDPEQSLRGDPKMAAERDWGRCAVVRFVHDVEAAAPFDEAPTRYPTGHRMRLWQSGRRGPTCGPPLLAHLSRYRRDALHPGRGRGGDRDPGGHAAERTGAIRWFSCVGAAAGRLAGIQHRLEAITATAAVGNPMLRHTARDGQNKPGLPTRQQGDLRPLSAEQPGRVPADTITGARNHHGTRS